MRYPEHVQKPLIGALAVLILGIALLVVAPNTFLVALLLCVMALVFAAFAISRSGTRGMSLHLCPGCGRSYSAEMPNCPSCGRPREASA